ncbi:MAG: hypothetical protein CMB80_05485 [Flammeovirgaceae bacterium]|nr:hypothetical protein [Flammeovirgaceae bacterium]
MDKHQRFLNAAFEISTTVLPVTKQGARLAALIVYKGKVLSVGTNRKKSHPFQNRYRKNDSAIYLHAETDAIKKALREKDDLSKCTLYIARARGSEKYGFNPGLARPCVGCMRAIVDFGIRKVFYTTNEIGVYEEL